MSLVKKVTHHQCPCHRRLLQACLPVMALRCTDRIFSPHCSRQRRSLCDSSSYAACLKEEQARLSRKELNRRVFSTLCWAFTSPATYLDGGPAEHSGEGLDGRRWLNNQDFSWFYQWQVSSCGAGSEQNNTAQIQFICVLKAPKHTFRKTLCTWRSRIRVPCRCSSVVASA